ncbi:MAG: ribosomal L7Ae/L30e/S12e/Gadd45 family protein [Lachnospiraceae bacterium]|nr:ribosomal L7Ae/L30e/S12e/Gadd45 family protein [Lachnospiraceae bacterium]
MNESKIMAYLGLATKAGKLVSGEFMTEKSVKEGRALLVIVAEDSSDNTKKMFRNMCEFYHVPMYIMSNKEALGHGIGKQFRASVAVLDKGLADAIIKQM